MNEIGKVARFPQKNIYAVYPTYKQAKRTLWKPLYNKLRSINWLADANKTDLTMLLKNGTTISLCGADNPDSLRGVGLDFVCIDEFQLVDELAWKEVLRPTLATSKGSALFIGTPYGTANWAYDLFNRGMDPNEKNWQSFQFTTLDGGQVTQEEIEESMRDMDIRSFRQEYLATFESYANRVFYAFDREHNVKKFDSKVPHDIYVGMDFNVGIMSAVLFARNKNHIHAFDEVAITSSNTDEMIDELRQRYPTNRIVVYPDPAGNQRKTSASGRTDITILKNAGMEVKVKNVTISVRDGINAVNSKLCSATSDRTFLVDPKCKKTIESLDKHSYKEGTSQPDKDSGYDHFGDAIRYYIDYDFPIRRDLPPEQRISARFGHAIG